jgi:threonine/homoserine/homoserine lactone efflux protein
LIIPGPTIILVISQSIAHGRKAVLPLSAGVVAGDFTAMTLSLLGLGAVLASSAALFSIFVRTQSHTLEQFVILGATFLVLAGVNAMLYGFFAGRLRDAMLKTGIRRLFNRCGGSALVGAPAC